MSKAEVAVKPGITSYLSAPAVKNNIISVIGEKSAPTFIASVVSAVQANPTLKECSNQSVLSAALLGESLKLTPSPQLGQYYLVPYKTKSGEYEAQFQMGANGYKQLAIRTGQYRKLVVNEIKDGELKSYNPITEDFEFEPIMDAEVRASRPTIGYYAMFELTNGFRKELYWPKAKMEDHAKRYSQGYRTDLNKNTQFTFWSKDFDGMAKKTMIRQLISKWGIMSVEMQRAYDGDMGIIREDGAVEYVDNSQSLQESVAEEVAVNANKETFNAGFEVIE